MSNVNEQTTSNDNPMQMDTENINLKITTNASMDNTVTSSSTGTSSTPASILKTRLKKMTSKENTAKNPLQLSLKISPTAAYAETDNYQLSSSGITITNNLNASETASTDTEPDSSSSVFPHEQYKKIRRLDIGFENITFGAKTGFFKREYKEILKGLNGEFRAGELNAIVGPSGAGKSTLLNILSAYRPTTFNGLVNINGKPRDIKLFKPNVAFIMQDTSLQHFLTVNEAMLFAANLKIGPHMSTKAKKERVRKILEAIGMNKNSNTRTGDLSGGQKKRLAIALELVNNPPVLILDEPTSGLDSSTANQLVLLLKKLALEGRNIICTIHQPSATAFELFDHLYAIAEGQCIYSGGSSNLLPFLADLDLVCPEFHNPLDYLMEISTHDFGPHNPRLIEKIQHGRNDEFRQSRAARRDQMQAVDRVDTMVASALLTSVRAPMLTPPPLQYPIPSKYAHNSPTQLAPISEVVLPVDGSENDADEKPKEQEQEQKVSSSSDGISKTKADLSNCCRPQTRKNMPIDPAKLCKHENIYATSFLRQLSILLVRSFLILWRDQSLTTMRFVIHFVTALLIGFLYYNIGNDGNNTLNNYRYIFYTIMFIMYCAFSSILVKFPLEFPIVSREHFNRWYSLRAYYTAMTLADIPIQIICTSLFTFTTYFLTNQPWEIMRLSLFFLIIFLTALVGQSIGLAVGSALSVQLGCIFGPFFICPFLQFSGFFLQEQHAPVYLRWMYDISFLKYSLDGAALAIFGYDRAKLECNPDISYYCHYTRPQYLLKDLDMSKANYEKSTIFLILLFLGLRIVAFYIMSFRLRIFR